MIIRLYWWKEFREDGLQNYGDLMSKYLVEKLSKKIVISTRGKFNKYFKRLLKKHYIVIGSVIGAANKNSIVWGSGIIERNQKVGNSTFLAIRGPKTRKRLMELNYDVPEIYGDPAILLPQFIKDDQEKKYEFGVIPHFVDYQLVIDSIPKNSKIKVINLLTNSVEETTRQILQCKTIISSSLHGVIVGHTYRIPSLWLKFSDKLSGDDVKFFDYFESMSIDFKAIITVSLEKLDEETIEDLFIKYESVALQSATILETRQKQLLASCPF